MGNALDFLDKAEKKKKESIEARKETSDTVHTVCPEASIKVTISPECNPSANHKQGFYTTIPAIGARMKSKRKTRQCGCCEKDFKPNAYTSISGKIKYTIYCDACSGAIHAKKRSFVKKIGSYSEYLKYKALPTAKSLNVSQGLKVIQDSFDFRVKHNLPRKRVEKLLNILLEEAKNKKSFRREEDFDF